MEITKEIKSIVFDTSKIHKGDMVYIIDNELEGDGDQGEYFVNDISETVLRIINYKGDIITLAPLHFISDNPQDESPRYEIKIIKY